MVSQSTLDLIPQTLLPQMPDKVWRNTMVDGITDPVVRLLSHYIGLYDPNKKWNCFPCSSNLFNNSLNVPCFHDRSHPLWIFDESKKYTKIIWDKHGRWLILLSKTPLVCYVNNFSTGEYKEFDSHPPCFYWLSKENPTQCRKHFKAF